MREKRPDRPIISYNLPRRRQALIDIRRMIVEEGLSHTEIQMKLNIPEPTYFRYLDILFEKERDIISSNTTDKQLLNETLLLREKYMQRSKKLNEIIDDKNIDADARVKANVLGAELDKAAHALYYEAPSYLARRGRLPSLTAAAAAPSLSPASAQSARSLQLYNEAMARVEEKKKKEREKEQQLEQLEEQDEEEEETEQEVREDEGE